MHDLQRAKKNGLHLSGSASSIYSAAQGGSASTVHVKACEDYTRVKVLDHKGVDITPPGNRRYIQDYTVQRISNRWKVTSLGSRPVSSFNSYGCGQ